MAVDVRHAAVIPAVENDASSRRYWRVIYSNTTGSLSLQKVKSFSRRDDAVKFMNGLPTSYILYGVRKPMIAELQRVDLEIEHRIGVSSTSNAR